MATGLEKLVSEWNFDFDPNDKETLDWAEDEIASFLHENQDDTDWLVQYLRPYIREAIIWDLIERIEFEEQEERDIY